jgi:hypothetical protein
VNQANASMIHSIHKQSGNLTNLLDTVTLYLDDNFLSGTIPTIIGKLTNMVDLRLAENMFTGVIPSEICKLHILRK